MFRKLRLLFILTNLGIICFLFVTLTVGVYAVLQVNMVKAAESFAEQLSLSINSRFRMLPEFRMGPEFGKSPRPSDFSMPPPMPSPGLSGPPIPPKTPQPGDKFLKAPPFFWVKVDSGGKITFISPGISNREKERDLLVERIFQTDKISGIIRYLDSRYFYYKASLTEETGMLMIFQDLKPQKTIQQSLVWSLTMVGIVYFLLGLTGSLFMARRAIAPIEKAWRQQKNFLADVSHELRTPLAVIQTNLDAAMTNPEATVGSQKDWFDMIREELKQMIELVSSLLFLARVEAKQYEIKKTKLFMDQVVLGICERFQPLAAAKGIDLTAHSEPVQWIGDVSGLREVLGILLDNAIRHTDPGGTITIMLFRSGKKAVLTVNDTGEGIAAEHLDKIFDRFYQVDASRSKGKSGLGLAIAKGIIENHHGTIRAESKPGAGSSFVIQLPLETGEIN